MCGVMTMLKTETHGRSRVKFGEEGQKEGTGEQIYHGACFTTQANRRERTSEVKERKDLVFALKELFVGLNVRWKLNPWVKRWGQKGACISASCFSSSPYKCSNIQG